MRNASRIVIASLLLLTGCTIEVRPITKHTPARKTRRVVVIKRENESKTDLLRPVAPLLRAQE